MLTEAIRLIFTLALTVIGAYIAKKVDLTYVSNNLALIIFIIIGAGSGYVLGGVVGRQLTRLVKWIDEKTKKIPSAELATGVGGLVIGLVIASLLAKPIEALLKPFSIISPYAISLTYFVLAYLGFTIFVSRKVGFNNQNNNGSESLPINKLNVLDTSVLIDGRIAQVMRTGFIQGIILIPKFVIAELQSIADSSNDLSRTKGRRGLDALEQIKKQKDVKIKIVEDDYLQLVEVDDKLLKLCLEKNANLISNDYNLCKVALLQNIRTLNLNDLALTLKPVVTAGEDFNITILKKGKEKGQGVGYLDDGTMIVVENSDHKVGKTVTVTVTSVLQTSAGKMIFTKLKDD